MVVGEGFEPSKSVTADLQSAPFGRSGTPPWYSWFTNCSSGLNRKKPGRFLYCDFTLNREKMVVGEGFEPSKSVTADLQSAPFGRSGTPPLALLAKHLSR